MAYDIQHFDGVVNPVTGTDPYGTIKDAPSGTIINSKSNSDMQVFLQRMMDLAGITPNNLPDNVTNGFQLYAAYMAPKFDNTGIVWTNSGNNVWSSAGGGYYDVKYSVRGNIVTLCGVAVNSAGGTPATSSILTLPSAIRPAKTVEIVAMYGTLGVPAVLMLDIAPSGLMTSVTGIPGGDSLFLDNISYRLK